MKHYAPDLFHCARKFFLGQTPSLFEAKNPAGHQVTLTLHSLQHRLLTKGLQAPGTETVLKDWRISLFAEHYRRLDEPTSWGDVIPSGALLNVLRSHSGRTINCYQWKAGDHNLPALASGGYFLIRVRAHDLPLAVLMLPWLGLLFSVLLLLTLLSR